jgi:hypothetical protein
MKAKWMKLAGELLKEASNEFTNRGCNDWEFPADWTREDQEEFVKAMHVDNQSLEEFDPKYLHVPDWWVMSFLARKLKEAANV